MFWNLYLSSCFIIVSASPRLICPVSAVPKNLEYKENARIQLTGAEATDLAKRGITDAKAQTAFTNISDYGELNTQLSGEETITQSEKIGSELGYDPLGTQKLKNRQKRRVGEFAGGGKFAQSQALGGALKSGVGSAE